MTQPINDLNTLVEALDRIDTHELVLEFHKLQAVADWARRNAGINYEVGDRVVLTEDLDSSGGWESYRECLVRDAVGICQGIEFNAHYDRWSISFQPERCWSVSQEGTKHETRYWYGSVAGTPEGFNPPSAYEQEHHPEGSPHHFYVAASKIRKYEQ